MIEHLRTVVRNDGEGFLSPASEIVDDMRNGRMVILVDAQDRENEGDLIIPAQMATPDAVNFMAKHGRGLICLALTEERSRDLRLEQMVGSNRSRNRTAFTQSIEAREGISTGISAQDRARTIATAIDPTKSHDDIVSPGHVFPLVARNGGVLIRAGHTEASVDLARLAGLYPAAVICEIMNDDGTMARVPDLIPFAQRHGLKVGTIEDLIAYRLAHDRIVRQVTETDVTTAFGGTFRLHVYETIVDGFEHLALVKGNVRNGDPVLVRVHAVRPLTDLLGVDVPGDGGSLLQDSINAISDEGRGVLVLIRDLSAKGVSEWVTARRDAGSTHDDSDGRRQVEIGVGSQILSELGVREMVLLTNAPSDVYVGLEAFGLRIVGTRPVGAEGMVS